MRNDLEEERAHLAQGDAISHASSIAKLLTRWKHERRETRSADEPFPLVDVHGKPRAGLIAPRWLCHLLGLRHAAAHVVLVSPNGLVILQKRSGKKDTAPLKLDTSAGGHVGAGRDAHTAILAEMQEELGLDASALSGKLEPLGEPFLVLDRGKRTLDAEVVTAWLGRLAPGALDRVRFRDGEVTRLVLAPPAECRKLLAKGERVLAAGARAVLPRALDALR